MALPGLWTAGAADWFTRLADAMAERWVDATTPPPAVFPAFRASVANEGQRD